MGECDDLNMSDARSCFAEYRVAEVPPGQMRHWGTSSAFTNEARSQSPIEVSGA
jgi:hypothetical protein